MAAWLDYYKNHSGREYSDQFKYHYTDHPSIQVKFFLHWKFEKLFYAGAIDEAPSLAVGYWTLILQLVQNLLDPPGVNVVLVLIIFNEHGTGTRSRSLP